MGAGGQCKEYEVDIAVEAGEHCAVYGSGDRITVTFGGLTGAGGTTALWPDLH